MKKKYSRVIFICDGDAETPDLWSGLPYQLAQALMANGIAIVHKNIHISAFYRLSWRLLQGFIAKFLNKQTSYSFARSATYGFLQRLRIWLLLNQYKSPNTFVLICTSMIRIRKFESPVVLVTDWTYEHYITEISNRSPDFFEKHAIKREYKAIDSSTLLMTIFPLSAKRINNKLRKERAIYFGHGVNLYDEKENSNQVDAINSVTNKLTLLFVGRPKYKNELQRILNETSVSTWSKINFEIIGMSADDLDLNPSVPAGAVKFWGFLSKRFETDRESFYQALRRADLIVSPNWPWGPFSAILEAMYFQTAVITRPYTEFVEIFGVSIDFGWYLTQDSTEEFEMILLDIAKNPEKLARAKNRAHEIASKMTWKQVACNLLKELESLG